VALAIIGAWWGTVITLVCVMLHCVAIVLLKGAFCTHGKPKRGHTVRSAAVAAPTLA